MFKKFNEMIDVLDGIKDKVGKVEEHVTRLLDSCDFYEQTLSLPQYTDQLYDNIEETARHYKAPFCCRDMYAEEVRFITALSWTKVRRLIDRKQKTTPSKYR